MKSLFEDELMSSMQKELRKQASAEKKPSLVKAADCLHAALEIFEQQGLKARADQVLQLLEKIVQSGHGTTRDVDTMPSIKALMEAGLTQRDMHEFAKGSPIAKAKFNLVLRQIGLSDHQIGKFIGPTNVMSEDEAKQLIDPNRSFSKIYDWMKDPETPVNPNDPQPGESLEFKSIAQKKSSKSDGHTKGLTPEKEVENLKHHGTPFNMADDACAIDVPPPIDKKNLSEDDLDSDFVDLLKSPTFDIDASDDELMGMEIKEDSLEVFEADVSLEDFEDERD